MCGLRTLGERQIRSRSSSQRPLVKRRTESLCNECMLQYVYCYLQSTAYRNSGIFLMTSIAHSNADRVLQLARETGVLRSRDLARHGIAREYLTRLTRAGLLERAGRGLYVLPDAELTEHHSLAEAAKRVPAGIVCLLSALRFHELTTPAPFPIWPALPPTARPPPSRSPPLRVVRFSGPALTQGVEEHLI